MPAQQPRPHCGRTIPHEEHDVSSPFNPDNRAYRRFLTVIGEHFDVGQWFRDSDQQPVMVTMTDLHSGDMFTIGLMDSDEDTAPHILAAIDLSGGITAYGPFTGNTAANSYAATAALSRPDVAATRALPLYLPDKIPPLDLWTNTPDDIAETIHPADADGPTAILVLVYRQQPLICAIGPFPDHSTAASWPLLADLAPTVQRLTAALHHASDAV
ncbi:hypothetical protein HDA40_002131 [Hamadaea flava]|uniref:Uncharacterized protein n=1 Tax=Hamadaea flava TaxID=1742688 RepID=A0ABV8LKN7_9ACTN|nr:hypothetical protein [Hamadaea flava]MCP2323624.1 hypothetical protein [Hamadaea flava]